jgi:hypothetical protein
MTFLTLPEKTARAWQRAKERHLVYGLGDSALLLLELFVPSTGETPLIVMCRQYNTGAAIQSVSNQYISPVSFTDMRSLLEYMEVPVFKSRRRNQAMAHLLPSDRIQPKIHPFRTQCVSTHEVLTAPSVVERTLQTEEDIKCALYRWFDSKGRLLYVGMSLSLIVRQSGHKRSAPWFKQIASQTVEWYPDEPTAHAAEIAAIRSENPKYNKQHN